ncbi:Wzz/FepE/Etk N-terminal domain-containing protein [Methylobacterium sp. E-065]|uniref:GumC family protein n=1 Tax=Methylobacterium sp. E-065 TaxID=2836583 RepID=UPI001FBB61A4|nr:Wzz/FepE/Etk N-terminal domain-containing protein [Methylobacterium sp. E-065]MCJ2017621.1 Wzz/FepE/Etk N-terminal domain-containing protein [Methylobacterium sp. E-065]
MLDKTQIFTANQQQDSIRRDRRHTGLEDLFDFLRKWARIIAGSAVVFAILAYIYVQVSPPDFVASAQILINPPQPQQMLKQDSGLIDLTLNNSQVESQIEIIRSYSTILPVVQELKLDTDDELALPNKADAASQSNKQLYGVVGRFASRLDVKRVSQSYIIQVSFKSQSASKASKIVNALCEAYIKNQLARKVEDATRSREWLEHRVQQLQAQLHKAAHAAQDFRTGVSGQAQTTGQLDAEVTLSQLDSATTTYRKMYESALEKLTENVQSTSFLVADANIVSSASPDLARVFPNPKLVIAVALLGGALFGVSIAALLDSLDTSVRSTAQIEDDLNCPCFGKVNLSKGARRPLRSKARLKVDTRTKFFFNRVMVAVEAANLQNARHTIGIVAIADGTASAILTKQLANTLALSGKKTLIVDASMSATNPLTTLTYASGFDTAIPTRDADAHDGLGRIVSVSSNLSIIKLEASIDTASTFGAISDNLVFSSAVSAFDSIITNLPDLESMPTSLSLLSNMDAIILVAHLGKSSQESLSEAADFIRASGTLLLGVVLDEPKA